MKWMQRLFVCLFVCLWGAFLLDCGPKDQCDPTCPEGQVCQEGQCVAQEVPPEKKVEKKQEVSPEERPEVPPEEGRPEKEPLGEELVIGEEKTLREEKVAEKRERPPEEKSPTEPVMEEQVVEDGGGEGTPETPRDGLGPEPTVQITEPAAGATLKGKAKVKVSASVDKGRSIDRVELHVDGRKYEESKNSPYEFELNTVSLKDGKHSLKAIAFTDWGNQKEHEISFTSANFGPTITFTKPKASAAVTGKFDIEVTVSDPAGVKSGSVMLEVDLAQVQWTTSSGPYKASFDPAGKPYDSLPIKVSAENKNGVKSSKTVWVSYDPPAGPKKVGEECDNSDAQKRCIAGHSCLLIGGAGAKAKCYKNCVVGGTGNQCPPMPGVQIKCQPTQMGTTRGACTEWTPQQGTLYSTCGGTKGCNAGLVCVGSGAGSVSYCLDQCSNPKTPPGPCKSGQTGFICVPLQGLSYGACVQLCNQACKTNSDCSTGQKCTGNKCSGCPNYGKCTAISGLGSVCI